MSLDQMCLSDRISGSLFGLLVCDSLGTAVETQPPGSFDPVTTLRGGGKFHLKPRQFTDDASMALCLAIALLNDSSMHLSLAQMKLYRRWYECGYLSSTGESFDIGITVRTAINKFVSVSNQMSESQLMTMDAYFGSTSNKASGNGSLMRLAPVPLIYHRNPQHCLTEAMNSSKTTHGSLLCLDSCRVYSALMIGALQGASKEELLNSDQIFVPTGLSSEYWTLDPSALAVMNGSYKQRHPPQIKASGFVIDTMEAALWAFYHTNSFEEGALKAVNLGDDADTVGAVDGMLVGAYYGFQAIPTEWRNACSFGGLVQTIADELLSQSQQQISLGPSDVYQKVMKVYDGLATFYSGTIKRRVLPCPKQYKSVAQLEEDVHAFHSIYENILKSIRSTDKPEEVTTDDQEKLVLGRCDSIFKQFLSLIEEDKRILTMKWSRNSNHPQMNQSFIALRSLEGEGES